MSAIDKIMKLLPAYYDAQSDAHQFGGEANKSILAEQENKIRLTVERYAKEIREKTQDRCSEICRKRRIPNDKHSVPDWIANYNDGIDGCVVEIDNADMEDIK